MAWSSGYNYTSVPTLISNGTYLFSNGMGNIIRTDIATGQNVNYEWLAPAGGVGGLFMDNTTLYLSSDNIYTVDSTSETPTMELFYNGITNPGALVVVDGYVYVMWYDSVYSNFIAKIEIANKNGPNTNLNWLTGYGGDHMVYYDNKLYFGDNPINVIDLTQDPPQVSTFLSISNGFFVDIAFYDNIAYVAGRFSDNITPSFIRKVDLNGTILDDAWQTLPYASALVIEGTDLYCADDGDNNLGAGAIYKFPLAPPQALVCFKEGSKILTDKGYRAIEDLRKGDLVMTSLDGYKAIELIGKRDMYQVASTDRIKDQLYCCSPENYPEMTEDLMITGCHCILVDEFVSDEQKETTIEVNGRLFATDRKYRLPACVDTRASVYQNKGNHTIYHIALEHPNYYMNYGVYANGLLVETCSRRYLKELSNMTLIE